jgi:predicted nucleotidyltransferase
LRTCVLRWPDRDAVDRAVRAWADRAADDDPRVAAVGYFGSYARGTWGVGSDVDVVVLLAEASEPFERRTLSFDTRSLPVPPDLFVYTVEEWERLAEAGALPAAVAPDLVWVLRRATS